MNVPSDLLYTKSHEWVRVDGDTAVIGITDFAQQQLSDLTFVELPSVGDQVSAGDEVAVVESVKAASDVYSPITGTVTQVNDDLERKPELLNQLPYEDGWLFEITIASPGEIDTLMKPDAYADQMPKDA